MPKTSVPEVLMSPFHASNTSEEEPGVKMVPIAMEMQIPEPYWQGRNPDSTAYEVTLKKLHDFSMTHFPHPENGYMTGSILLKCYEK